jgi:hypothetical protein
MDKDFDLGPTTPMNLRHFLNGQLPGQHYPFKTQISEFLRCQRVMD